MPNSALLLARWFARFLPVANRPSIAGMPISPEVLADLRESDRFIVSFPRSGNTWLRHLLQELIIASRPDCPRPESLEVLQATVHRGVLERPAAASFGLPWRLLKSHNIRDLRGHRMVYLFREPADAIVSYYHLRIRKGGAPSLNLGQFCGEMLGEWCAHVRLGLEQAATFPERTLFVAYEQMKSAPTDTLRRVVDFLGWDAGAEQISTAVETCSFDRLRAREQRRKPQIAEKEFFRKGRVGGGAEELGPELLAHIEAGAGPLYERAWACAEAAAPGAGAATIPSKFPPR